jgi:hypothetical protein
MISYLRHLFIPHHTNNHRPKFLHANIVSVLIIVLLAGLFALQSLQSRYPSVLGISVNITIDDLLNLTNQKRAEAGLHPLSLSQELSNAASSKASYMFEKDFWAHVAPDGTTPWYFIRSAGYEYQYAGENLARGFDSADEVVNAWMASPTHRENLLSPNYKDIGFAVGSGSLTGSETILVVQAFGSRYANPEETFVATSDVPAGNAQPSPAPTLAPTPVLGQSGGTAGQESTIVAAAVNNPLIDTRTAGFNVAVFLLGVFILILIVDAVIIERRKIVRIVSHNLDHIIYLVIVLAAVIIIARGLVL